MLVGAGALEATDEVIAVAERLQAGVAKALLGKAALPDDLPFVTGSIGLLGTKPSWDLMKGCDTFLMVGSAFPYSEFLPKPGDARGRADRYRRQPAEPALSDGSQYGRRQRHDAAGAAADADAKKGNRLAALRSKEGLEAGGRRWKNAPWIRRSRSIPARVLGTVAAASGQCHHHRRFPDRSRTGMRAI